MDLEDKDKILVVDDASGWRIFHAKMINNIFNDKYIVEIAESAKEGYDMAYNNLNKPYKLIITDLQMETDFEPKYAGEWFVEQIKLLKEYSKTQIVIVSATFNIDIIAQNLGVNYIPKRIAVNEQDKYIETIKKILA